MKILALHLYNFLEYARIRGVEESKMLSQMVNPPANFLAEDVQVDDADFWRVVSYVHTQLQDDLLGIRLGEFMNVKLLGLIYQISLQTTTLEEALFYLKNYLNVTFPLIQIKTAIVAELATISLEINTPEPTENRLILENVLTIISRELRIMTRPGLEIQFTSPFYHQGYPANWSLGEQFTLTFTNAVLKASLQDKSRWQLDVLVPEYLKLIERLKADNTFSAKVKITMLSMAQPKLPDLDKVADAFNMTPRTLQRRLDTENISFRTINTTLKREISCLLINHNRYSVADISEVLGFSEPASFIHSFKKWFGHSPDKFRRQLAL